MMCQCLTASDSAGCHECCRVDVHNRWSRGSHDCSPGGLKVAQSRTIDHRRVGRRRRAGALLANRAPIRPPSHHTPLFHRDDDGSLRLIAANGAADWGPGLVPQPPDGPACRRRHRWRRPPRKRHGARRRRSHDGLAVRRFRANYVAPTCSPHTFPGLTAADGTSTRDIPVIGVDVD